MFFNLDKFNFMYITILCIIFQHCCIRLIVNNLIIKLHVVKLDLQI